MTTKVHIDDLHAEVKEWKSQVALSIDELKVFKKQLAEILSKNNNPDVAIATEHFQNQFRRHDEALDDLSDELLLADEALVKAAGNNHSADHILLDKNPVLKDKVQTATHLFTDLKAEFRAFEEKWY